MKNMGQIIKSHNAKLLNETNRSNPTCNCQIKRNCPLKGKCTSENVIYRAHVIVKEDRQPSHDRLNQAEPPSPDRPNQRIHQLRNINNETIDNNNADNTQDTHLGTNTQNTQNTPYPEKEMFYIGAAANFKHRYMNHLKSFRHEIYKRETELSKYI